MVRSPAEEEGKDAGTGSGSWPRSRRYAVGDEVEVLFTGPGFRGARFEATVTARLPGSGRYKVLYSELLVRRGGPPLREVVVASDVRPRPPPPPPGRELELFDLVEAYHSDGWWPGVVSDIRPKRRRNQETQFAVSLPLFREVVVLSASFVRPRREFVYGSWINAQEVALASKRKDLSVSSLDDVIEIGSKYNFGDVVVISDDSSHGSFIEISDDSSYNPIKMQSGGENQEMCPKITEVNSWVAGTSIKGAANQKTVNQSYGGAFPIGKLEPSSSRLQDIEGSLLCIEAPNDNKIDTENKKTGISPEEAAAFLIGKLEPPSSGQKGVKADLVCIEARNDNKVEIKNERMAPKDIAIISYTECNASSQQPWGQPLEPVSEKSSGPSSLLHPGLMVDTSAFMPLAVPNSSNLSPVFSTTSLLLMPKNKMEVFEKLPQNPHFRKAWNCPPELRGGRAIGLMVSFADMAESIKNMRIQDEPRLYEEKMSILLDMEEENGFEAGPLKVRLHNLLCTRTCQINLKSRKVRLEKEIFEIEAINCGLEQQLKVLDMCVMGMEEKKYQEMKASLDMQKTENCSSISKLQVDLCQVEESLKYAEADFCSIATAPWQSDAAPLLQ